MRRRQTVTASSRANSAWRGNQPGNSTWPSSTSDRRGTTLHLADAADLRSLRLLLADRNVCGAVANEGLTFPAAPALAQRHAREPRHQVEIGGPYVTKRRREDLKLPVDDPVVVRDKALRCDVVLVEADMRWGYGERSDGLPGGSRCSAGTSTSITKQPPGSRHAATLRKRSGCSSCVVRFSIVLRTR